MNDGWAPVNLEGTQGSSPFVLVCEHASHACPPDFPDLGLSDAARRSHAAWDIGALDVARHLSKSLDAPLASCGVSRLLFDCNRPPSAVDSIPVKSELIEIPGNVGLDETAREVRATLIHDPFHSGVASLIAAQQRRIDEPVMLVTIHSFTPVFFGKQRDIELGFLHHGYPELCQAMQHIEVSRGRYRSAINQPYDASDGVTYSLEKHGDANGLHSVMIEIRNDLVDTEEKARSMAAHLSATLKDAAGALTYAKECAE